MKKLLTLAAIAGVALTALAGGQPKKQQANARKVDAKESTFKWTGKKVTGEHWGAVKFSDGTITTDGKNVTGGTFNLDMTTIDVQDMQGEYADKLTGHLKSDDFFSTEKFKTATLTIKTLEAIKGAVAGQSTHNVTADLTIKGITKTITFPAMIVVSKEMIIANAEFAVDRTQYDVKYKGMSDNLIDDKFTVKVRVIAK